MRDEWLKPPPPNLMLPNSVPHPSLALIDVDPIYLWIYIQRLLLCPQAPRTNVPTSKALLSKKKMMKKKNSNSMKVFKKKNLTTTKKKQEKKEFSFSKKHFCFHFSCASKSTCFGQIIFVLSSLSLSSCWSCRDAISRYTKNVASPTHFSSFFSLLLLIL